MCVCVCVCLSVSVEAEAESVRYVTCDRVVLILLLILRSLSPAPVNYQAYGMLGPYSGESECIQFAAVRISSLQGCIVVP